jgi:hypothetical protein
VPLEQAGADFGLQRLHPVGDIGLHGVEFIGGAGDAAQARDGRKGHQIGQFHESVSFLRWQRSEEITYEEC